MTQEENDLLLKDLCARLPYKPICQIKFTFNNETTNGEDVETIEVDELVSLDIPRKEGYFPYYGEDIEIENIKPYLRPMSSMTEEENKQRKELSILLWYNSNGERGFDGFGEISGEDVLKAVDWLNAHHFDYRGLIKKGLALEAPEDMYKK